MTSENGMSEHRHVAIVANHSIEFDRQDVRGIGRFVREHGQWIPFVQIHRQYLAKQLKQWSGDGIIAALDDPKVFDLVSDLSVPVVGFGYGGGDRSEPIPYLTSDDVAIAQMGAQHLLDRGFTNFAFCAKPTSSRISQPWSENRATAFIAAVEEAGYECSVYRESATVSIDWDVLFRELCQWVKSLPKPVGLMACYDVRALYVLEACTRVGIRVPEEVAVIGVDNEEVICELANPPLSSVIQGATRLGYEAATLLERLMNGEMAGSRHATVPPAGIVTRQSTDVLAIEDSEVAAALHYIREHAFEGIGVTDVVKQVSISRDSLDMRFKSALNRTVHGELQRIQIDRVKQLLRSTDWPISEIARRSGFRYREYLSNVFHRITGQTLGEYRDHVETCGEDSDPTVAERIGGDTTRD